MQVGSHGLPAGLAPSTMRCRVYGCCFRWADPLGALGPSANADTNSGAVAGVELRSSYTCGGVCRCRGKCVCSTGS